MGGHASVNRIYRLIWSHAQNTWVIVSELTRGQGKRSRRRLVAASLLAAVPFAQAGPIGGQVTAGNGSVAQAGNVTTVTQSSQHLSLNWQSFNTSAADTINFVQPSAAAIAVNRVLDNSPTQFFGRLNANGQVYLINPNGVLFGAGSQVNVGGLVASTLDTSNSGLANSTRRFSGSGTGSVINQGSINIGSGGYLAFIGNSVSNQGSITAPSGTVAMGAGNDVTLSFAGNSLLKLQVNQSTLDNLAENRGLIRADGGAVYLSAGAKDAVLASVVNNSGVIEARSVQKVNGTIVLGGGAQSTVTNSGTLEASGRNAAERGGTVKVLGDQVRLLATSKIDATGDAGGGTVLVGGNFLGAGPEQNAKNTTVAAGSSISADALTNGDGGQVAVWSDGATDFNATITARGGQAGGNGGSVETSGKHLKVGASAAVSTLAAQGRAGEWLLDPQDFTIGSELGQGDIAADQITAALQSSSVTIKTGSGMTCTGVSCGAGQSGNGDIILADGAYVGADGWSGGTTLTLSAYRNVEFRGYSAIDASNGSGSIVLRADNTGTGIGTVIFGTDAYIYGGGGTTKIYYNPSNYNSPTDYSSVDALQTGISAYMLVNLNVNVANKTYDGSTSATIQSISTLLTPPAGTTIDVSGVTANFATKAAGSGKAVTISGVALTGVNASQYALNGLDSVTATISKANVTVSGVTASNKTYDGTTAATLSGTATVTALGSDVVSVSGTGTGTFSSKNVGANQPVTVSGYTLSGADAGNYNIVQPTGLTASITKANLAVSGIIAANKTYDGTSAATLSGTAAVSAFGSDVVSVTGSATASFADKNAGAGKAVTVSGYSLTGSDAGNYNIVQPAGLTATISKADLAVSGLSAANKIYDGTTSATLGGIASVSALGSDVVAVTGTGTGTFANKNAGTGKAVTVTGYSLTGTDAGNYNIVQPVDLTATINKASLSLSGISANNKTYDGSTAATISGTAVVAALGSDVVSVSGTGAGSSFATKDVGTGKSVTVAGYTLTGTDATNYNLIVPTHLTANVSKADIVVSGITAAGKTYDGSAVATLNGTASVSAFGADVVGVSGTGVGSFVNKNAGTDKDVTVSGYSLTGSDAGNYNVVQPVGLTATISKADLTVSGVSAANKTYDSTTSVTLSGTASVSAFGSDVVSVTGTGTGSFADKNAGTGKAITVTGYSLTGTDAGNYNAVQPAGLTATISKADLTVSGLSAADKTYDGSTAAVVSGTASVNPFGSDVVSVSGTGTGAFANKSVGANKAVTVSGYSLTGPDAGNYNLVSPAGLTAGITAAPIVVTGIVANDKSFDGTTRATVSTAGAVLTGKIGSDVVTVSATGTFVDAAVGDGKLVNLSSTYGGADAGNYLFTDQATAFASITPQAIPDRVVQGSVAQVHAAVLPSQATVRLQSMNATSAPPVWESDGTPPQQSPFNQVGNPGMQTPLLKIQRGGMQLPSTSADNAE